MFGNVTKARIFWDILVFVCILYASVEAPLRIVISYEQGLVIASLYFIVDFIFFCDIFWNFFTYSEKHQSWKWEKKSAIIKYFRTWFALDLTAAFPFEFVTQLAFGLQQSEHPHLYLVLGITRIVKALRIAGILHRLNIALKPAPGILRLVLFGFWVGVVAHWCAVGWLYLDQLEPTKTGFDDYIKALYWTVTTLATVGYGDITASNTTQRIYAMIVMILGVGVYATVIGNIATILSNLDMVKAEQQKRMAQVDSFLRSHGIPFDLRRKVRDFYMYRIERGWVEDENKLLSDLPNSVQREIKIHLHKELLERVPFLRGANPQLVTNLVFALKPVMFLPGDIIFHKGDVAHHLYILSQGSVDVLSENEESVLVSLHEGQFFGELALVTEEPRSATIRTRTTCETYTLFKADFLKALDQFPEFRKVVEFEVSKRRIQHDSREKRVQKGEE
ncbi:cyclic nucleotide-binding protein [Leptospira perolatii]|uniref:Cyclic nucleotide-binding protein n=1 Tax=Leptospira perolatii TaxID=2023191 RepID=A0A2M9ZLY5_9LEPT|nr:ion transporter [Leptospira perolatii]PJZ69156.1 cyclic nucleotide-binding protein [Leptospira perolatii]PJZ73100.1 cyclic nucleotide-binding protein [Leptospira perolatii]